VFGAVERTDSENERRKNFRNFFSRDETRPPASAAIPTSFIKAATRELGRVDRARRESKSFTETNEKMSTKNRKSRWNRFQMAFDEGNRPERAACERDWRKKTSEMGSLGRIGKTANSTQESAEEVDAKKSSNNPTLNNPASQNPGSQNPALNNPTLNNPTSQNPALNNPTSQNPTSQNPALNDPASNNPTLNNPTSQNPTSNNPTSNNPTSNNPTSQNPTSQNPALKKRSLGAVPSFWEQARRTQADAESKKRADPTLKSALKSLKPAKFGASALEAKEFPFPRRPRTFRSSEPPRRFDDPRKD